MAYREHQHCIINFFVIKYKLRKPVRMTIISRQPTLDESMENVKRENRQITNRK